jgi:starch synthase
MAAGLPVVVSDWDGYRDTVEHGVQGFRIPTTMPPPPLGVELAWRYASGIDSYDVYIGHASQLTAVDVGACAKAYATLIRQPALRHSMGEAGRRRALAFFDWSRIVERYEALWRELEARRETDAECPDPESGEATQPLQDDPFRIFRSYPSYSLEGHSSLALRRFDYRHFVKSVRNHPLASLTNRFLATEEECEAVLADLAEHPNSLVSEVLERTAPKGRREILYRTLAWLAKVGLLAASRGRDR